MQRAFQEKKLEASNVKNLVMKNDFQKKCEQKNNGKATETINEKIEIDGSFSAVKFIFQGINCKKKTILMRKFH